MTIDHRTFRRPGDDRPVVWHPIDPARFVNDVDRAKAIAAALMLLGMLLGMMLV